MNFNGIEETNYFLDLFYSKYNTENKKETTLPVIAEEIKGTKLKTISPYLYKFFKKMIELNILKPVNKISIKNRIYYTYTVDRDRWLEIALENDIFKKCHFATRHMVKTLTPELYDDETIEKHEEALEE